MYRSPPFVFSTARLCKVHCLAVVVYLIATSVSLADEPLAVSTTGQEAMVVSVSQPATDVGAAVLRDGGNAVDAAVAVGFALAVTWPEAGNIGGGGFMMIAPGPNQSPVCVDYRETAPAAAKADMFSEGTDYLGHEVVGTPGTVAGFALAHERYGNLPWKRLVEPAVKLAAEGFAIDAALAEGLNELLVEAQSEEFAEFQRIFARPDGEPWQSGDTLVQPDLASTLQLIADEGPPAFYRGAIAEKLTQEMELGDGLITLADLREYTAKIRQPIHGTFHEFDIYGAPPPSSGGIVVVEVLNILEQLDLSPYERWSPQAVHLVIEAVRRAYLDRARHLGDPDFVSIPEFLTSKKYVQELASGIDRQRATSSLELASEMEIAGEGDSTTHFCVVDGDGMGVSNTYTIESSWGSRVVVRGAGFLLNNEMTDFNHRPGYTNRLGAIGTPANTVVPGKRMLSSQCPVIVLRDGQLYLLTGSPGGRTIPNTVLCVLLGVLQYENDLVTAVSEPRLHHQWLPDILFFEGRERPEFQGLVEQLEAMGHTVAPVGHIQGDAHSIYVTDGKLIGVTDQRRTRAKPVGW